jgi:hypothetical protein
MKWLDTGCMSRVQFLTGAVISAVTITSLRLNQPPSNLTLKVFLWEKNDQNMKLIYLHLELRFRMHKVSTPHPLYAFRAQMQPSVHSMSLSSWQLFSWSKDFTLSWNTQAYESHHGTELPNSIKKQYIILTSEHTQILLTEHRIPNRNSYLAKEWIFET